MAEEKNLTDRKRALQQRIADNRETITQSRAVLKEQLKVKKQLRKLITRRPKALFVGSAAAGLLATFALSRRASKSSSRKPRTIKGIILTWGLSLLKPAAKKWVGQRLKAYLSQRLQKHPQLHPPERTEPTQPRSNFYDV